MHNKQTLIHALSAEFTRWQALLSGLSEAQLTTPLPDSTWSLKDVLAHLHAWQQLSIARFEAALANKDPLYPAWTSGANPDADEDVAKFNAAIYQTYRDHSWHSVHHAWQAGFHHLVELAEQIPEPDLLAPGKYPWLGEYPLSAVLEGWLQHHHEDHLAALQSVHDSSC